MVIFEVGSLLCALSTDIEQLIAGRAISGVGAAGLCAYYILLLPSILMVDLA